jgi:hypothetical protein
MPRAAVDVEDLLVRVKNGAGDADLAAVAREVAALAEGGRLGDGDGDGDGEDGLLVPALLARLAAAGTAEARVSVMAALRRLAGCVGGESKVSHTDDSQPPLIDCTVVLSSFVCHALPPHTFVFDAMLPTTSLQFASASPIGQ